MPDSNTDIYWDACAFLSYVNENPERMPVLDALLHSSADGNINIHTSSLSRVEVAFAASEQLHRELDSQEEQKIDGLWEDPSTISVVEFHDGIGLQARTLIRGAIARGWKLKPLDAIHLATAQWLISAGFSVAEFHTYDGGLEKYGPLVEFTICEPYTEQPRMI